VNMTQATDLGAVYRLDEIRGVTDVALAHSLKVHMDGARFANAMARLGCTPAEATWKSGVDILSFGMTKNGGVMADAIVVFSPDVAQQLAFHLRRAGQVWSKMRFASAQLIRYVEDGLWLDLARRSNAAAARIAAGLEKEPGIRLLAPVEANEVFVELPAAAMDALEKDGLRFFRRGPRLARFVCRWDTTDAEIRALTGGIARLRAAA
jgi:threonine aldolase